MNDEVLVEFIVGPNETSDLIKKLGATRHISITKLGPEHTCVSFRATSADLTILRLQDEYLSQRMRISYIDNALKDKYRKK